MHSEQIGELAGALAKAQSEITGAKKDSSNPFFKSKYADLGSTWDACRSALAGNHLSVAQVIGGTMEQPILSTLLLHASGQWIQSDAPLFLQKNDPQGMGSSISYMRRYALAAMVGVYSEDDDGEKAMNAIKPAVMVSKPIINHAPPPQDAPKIVSRPEPASPESWEDEPMPNFDEIPSPGGAKGDYVVEFGKYAGKKLRDISPPPLKGYVSYLKDEAQKSGKPLSGKAKAFVDAVSEYLR